MDKARLLSDEELGAIKQRGIEDVLHWCRLNGLDATDPQNWPQEERDISSLLAHIEAQALEIERLFTAGRKLRQLYFFQLGLVLSLKEKAHLVQSELEDMTVYADVFLPEEEANNDRT